LAGNFFPYHRFLTGSGSTQPPIQYISGALSLGINWPASESDYSSPSSA